MVFSASSREEQNLQRAVAEAFDIDSLNSLGEKSTIKTTLVNSKTFFGK